MEDKFSNIDEWLDEYSHGIITDAELKKRMEQHNITNYEELIATHKAAINIIQRKNVLHQVSNVHNKYAVANQGIDKPKAKSITFRANPLLRIAAVFLVILTSGAVFFVSTATPENLTHALSKEYHVQVSRSDNNQKISAIIRAFNNKDFAGVISEYDSLNKANVREMFLGAYAYLKTGNYSNANSVFKKILDHNRHTREKLYQDEAEYYLLLTLIQQEQYKEAYYFADKIHKDSYHTYHTNVSWWFLLKLKWLI